MKKNISQALIVIGAMCTSAYAAPVKVPENVYVSQSAAPSSITQDFGIDVHEKSGTCTMQFSWPMESKLAKGVMDKEVVQLTNPCQKLKALGLIEGGESGWVPTQAAWNLKSKGPDTVIDTKLDSAQ